MYTVIVCDDNTKWREELVEMIRKESQFEVVAQACNGRIAIELIEELRPEIIILDIVMPECDGVYIVNHIRKTIKGYDPFIYILSGLGTDSIIMELNELNVNFYSMKPVKADVIIRNLNIVGGYRNIEKTSVSKGDKVVQEDTLEGVIKEVLLRLGMKPHLISSKCVIDSLVIYMNSPESEHGLTKILYPQIAEKYCIYNSSVEKNIRSAVSRMQRNKTELYCEIFAYHTIGRITNGEFLSVMAGYIRKIMKEEAIYRQ